MIKRFFLSAALVTITAAVSAQETPYLLVLGVVQDAGYPQAGCYREHCMPGWEDPVLRRGATSLAAVDPDAKAKYLFEASTSMPEQLYRLNVAAPDSEYSLKGVFLTHAHIGHYTGLMHFGREVMNTDKLPVFAMRRMREFLETNAPWSQLVALDNIALKPLRDYQTEPLGTLRVTPMLVPHRDEFSETVGFKVFGPRHSALFIPDINKWELWNRSIVDEIRSVDYALLDATFFDGDELPGRDMAEIPHPFVVESMALFDELTPEERSKVFFIHMNHSNPLLDDSSPQHRRVRESGYNIAHEGLRLPL
jgi:pyrroloquinoline quinone biosynthesis protein B